MQKLEDIKPQQSIELLKSLHILTREGKINQDSRRKLKQVYHLYNFAEPILEAIKKENEKFLIVDHGCGKSYLGFILYDLLIFVSFAIIEISNLFFNPSGIDFISILSQ